VGVLKSLKSGNDPLKSGLIPLDAPLSYRPIDVLRVLVGYVMVDCRAIEAP
jgi:hypothetical protein